MDPAWVVDVEQAVVFVDEAIECVTEYFKQFRVRMAEWVGVAVRVGDDHEVGFPVLVLVRCRDFEPFASNPRPPSASCG